MYYERTLLNLEWLINAQTSCLLVLAELKNATIEERVTLLETQMDIANGAIADIEDDVDNLEGQVTVLFGDQVIQDEQLLELGTATESMIIIIIIILFPSVHSIVGFRTTFFFFFYSACGAYFVRKVDMVWNIMFIRLTSDHPYILLLVFLLAVSIFRLSVLYYLIQIKSKVVSMYMLSKLLPDSYCFGYSPFSDHVHFILSIIHHSFDIHSLYKNSTLHKMYALPTRT